MREYDPIKAIDAFLARCGTPAPISKEEELRRVRLQITGMSEYAYKVAEATLPGFQGTFANLLEKEAALSKRVEKNVIVPSYDANGSPLEEMP
jgi:hypothetical protein